MANTRRSERANNSSIRKGRTIKQRKRSNSRWLWIAAGVGIALVVLVVWLTVGRNSNIAGVQTFTVSQGHTTQPVTYEQIPPVGGTHNPVWQNCGIYSEPIQNEHAVHSLEHGAVWITYRPDLPAEQVQKLRELVQNRSYTLLSPYPGLEKPIVASAWGVQLQLDDVNDSRLPQFISKYVQGPQTPEPGASCSGGVALPAGQ